MSKTADLQNDVCRISTGNATTVISTTPLTVGIGLGSAAATELVVGTSPGYARVAAAAQFGTDASAGSQSNDGAVTFPQATGNWLSVTQVQFWDNTTAGTGTMMREATLTNSPVTVNDTDTAEFAIGDLTVTET